jgi:hypothetical protein
MADILNLQSGSELNPDFSYVEDLPELRSGFQAQSGKMYSRQQVSRGRLIEMAWADREQDNADVLRQFAHQHENGYFFYKDWERNRYYSGRFLGPLRFSPTKHNNVTITGTFVEIPGLDMWEYPTDFDRDGIILEEIDDFYQSNVKLTGTWDHRSKNYCIRSEEIDNGAWSNFDNAIVVTANAGVAPDGTTTAEQLDLPSSNGRRVQNFFSAVPVVQGHQFMWSIWLKALVSNFSIRIQIEDRTPAVNFQSTGLDVALLTSSWQRFFLSRTLRTGIDNAWVQFGNTGSPSSGIARSVLAWGGQLTYGSFFSEYVKTVASPVQLPVPNGYSFVSGLGAYFNAGTSTTDTAEWIYFGYGFQIWAPGDSDMGIMEVGCTSLDGTVEVQPTMIDLYSSIGRVASGNRNEFTDKMRLGWHRVKLRATNTKNASSSAFIIAADMLKVMR